MQNVAIVVISREVLQLTILNIERDYREENKEAGLAEIEETGLARREYPGI